MKDYVWRLDVEYPAEAYYDHCEVLDPEWRPKGWEPSEEYESRFGTEQFIWPAVRRFYLSRSTAVNRANLLESFGARVRLLRSQELEFEERGYKHENPTLRLVTGGAA